MRRRMIIFVLALISSFVGRFFWKFDTRNFSKTIFLRFFFFWKFFHLVVQNPLFRKNPPPPSHLIFDIKSGFWDRVGTVSKKKKIPKILHLPIGKFSKKKIFCRLMSWGSNFWKTGRIPLPPLPFPFLCSRPICSFGVHHIKKKIFLHCYT